MRGCIPGRGWACRLGAGLLLLCAMPACAQTPPAPQTPRDLVTAMTSRERDAAIHRELYAFLSNERSDRTGGHLWTERIAETKLGRVRMLLAEDGKPVSADRTASERARLANDVQHPDQFEKREEANKNDELRARGLIDKLPNGFLLENVRLQSGIWQMDFRPDPGYSPSGMEDRVLHGMSGAMSIDAQQLRLIHLDGRMANPISFGFGLLATLQQGSSFVLDKQDVEGTWRAVHVVTDLHGKAMMLKSISRSTEWNRSEFQHLDPNISVAQAVALVER